MAREPSVNARDLRQVVACGGTVGCKGAERLVIGEDALRHVVRALPRRTCVVAVAKVIIIERGTNVEGVERGVVVVTQPAPHGELRANLEFLLRQDIQTFERCVVVEGVPVELFAVVAHDERLQCLALLQCAALHFLTSLGQDERLEVVALQE